MADSHFPRWRLAARGATSVVAPDERLPWPQMVAMGVQHVVAMFGSTVLAPLLMGFDPNLCIFMSGIGTLLFFVLVGGRVPSYLGSSFAFIGLVVAVTGYGGSGANPNIPVALGGIIACGVVYAVIGAIVSAVGTRWIEALMPPVVTGAIVAVIGLNLALIAYAIYAIVTNGLGLGRPIDFSIVANAHWFGIPSFTAPVFEPHAMLLLAPVAVILVAENLGHIKAVSAMTGHNLDRYVGRAFIGDALATIVSGSAGGTGVTTYAENIGVMAVTRIYSTLVFALAALIAIGLGFSPKFGALIRTIPGPVLGGVSIVVFGLIAVTGARIWVVNRVDFSDNRNLIVAAVTLVLGAGDFSLKLGGFALGGIGTATFGAILLYALLGREKEPGPVV